MNSQVLLYKQLESKLMNGRFERNQKQQTMIMQENFQVLKNRTCSIDDESFETVARYTEPLYPTYCSLSQFESYQERQSSQSARLSPALKLFHVKFKRPNTLHTEFVVENTSKLHNFGWIETTFRLHGRSSAALIRA